VRQLFFDRKQAGGALGAEIARGGLLCDPVVLALPRGGVPVGLEVARALEAPLDVLIVRKLGHPWQPELAIGAIASGGVRVMNREVLAQAGVSVTQIRSVVEEETRELERRERTYRRTRPPIDVRGRDVVLVDDGIATGSTMFAAIEAVRAREPASVIVAVPVAPRETLLELRTLADRVVCIASPEPFGAIGLWYDRFEQVTDDQVRSILDGRESEMAAKWRRPDRPGRS
jgi:putative phosphoribosyl transferase